MTILHELQKIVGQRGLSTDPATLEPHLTDWRGAYTGDALVLVSPANTSEVAAVVAACNSAGIGIVPQGGNTSMCGGATPDASGKQILLSMARMNRVVDVDADNFSMQVEAGCILANAQSAAADANRLFALSLGSEGSCQVGGNIATDAGGINVLKYGTARAQVLGLEVVLADGSVINGLRSLRKDTAGYDLKQLFIGSEGTLGVITAATVRLFPLPASRQTALAAISHASDGVRLLSFLREDLGDSIEAFELMPDNLFALIERHIPGSQLPFADRSPWYVLFDVAMAEASERLIDALARAEVEGLITNAVVAKSGEEAKRLWRMRHASAEAEKIAGRALKHDISLPGSRMAEFLDTCGRKVAELAPGATLITFGHVGDGNLHYNVMLPEGYERGETVSDAIYSMVQALGGSFSAEHGIGVSKRKYLEQYRGGTEIALMRTLKATLDPNNTLNPGKVI